MLLIKAERVPHATRTVSWKKSSERRGFEPAERIPPHSSTDVTPHHTTRAPYHLQPIQPHSPPSSSRVPIGCAVFTLAHFPIGQELLLLFLVAPPVHRGNRVSRLLPQTLSLTQTLSRQKQKIVAVGTTGAVSENSLCRQLLKLTFSDCGFLFYFILDCTNLILQHLFFSLSVYLSNFSLFLSLLLSSV